MKARIFFISGGLVALSFISGLSSCTKNKGIPGLTSNNKPDTLITGMVSYRNDIVPLMVKYCYGVDGQNCHVSNTNIGANGNFENFDGLKAKVDNGSIESRVLAPDADMPPSYSTGPKPMTANEIEVIRTWVEQGAPNN
ncbi:MAG TPA: hypothetical protein VFV37_08665 [Luteibaculaceae bacterium]|nr:hypothetical protein [Luteibaculaceae bacterium]